jgi:alpha-tubulin suppressor-like RCC1 family protein
MRKQAIRAAIVATVCGHAFVARAESPSVRLADGGYHQCALTPDNSVWCWTSNFRGQLGDGTSTDRPIPVPVIGIPASVVSVSAKWYHSCAVGTASALWCWGDNDNGQIGDGTTTQRNSAVQVPLGNTVREVAAGEFHTCALLTNGTVRCWGGNDFGQLGDGTTTQRLSPVNVPGMASVAQIAANRHTCVLKTDGTVWCWGTNVSGQLGDGTTTQRTSPVQVSGLGSVTQITTGGAHTCALKSDGTAWCWGSNATNQAGGVANYLTPVQLPWFSNTVAQVAAGGGHTCALLTDATVSCWGSNQDGQVGATSAPARVSGLSGVVEVTAGGETTCARTGDGSVWCWGFGNSVGLGDGMTISSTIPVKVSLASPPPPPPAVSAMPVGYLGALAAGLLLVSVGGIATRHRRPRI